MDNALVSMSVTKPRQRPSKKTDALPNYAYYSY